MNLSLYWHQKNGFEKIDPKTDNVKLLNTIEPQGNASFWEAYAYGMGSLLNFHKNYLT